MLRKLAAFTLPLIIILLLFVAYNLYLNNKDTSWPSDQSIDSALVRSIEWLIANRSTIESDHNPGLWWMIKEAADISDKKSLVDAYTHYKENHLDMQPLNVWSPYFNNYYRPKVPDSSQLNRLSGYQLFFMYAITCDDKLAAEPVIQKQLSADFCGVPFIHPRCATHQQMAVKILLKSNCGNQEKLTALSSELIDIIHYEIFWDFRVTDSYLQRNLTLAEAGRIDLLKPIWIQRILDAQNLDGGWDDIHPLITLSSGNIIGFSSIKPVIEKANSSFHATAQGVWLLTLLQHHKNKSAP